MFKSIDKFKKLYSTRTDPSFWAENIIESSRLCANDRETKHFYAYVIDPNGYDFDHVESGEYKTLGDVIPENSIDVETGEEYPTYMETQVFKNGHEYTIYNKNNLDHLLENVEEEHDEKNPQ
jgi:hypothetical protein